MNFGRVPVAAAGAGAVGRPFSAGASGVGRGGSPGGYSGPGAYGSAFGGVSAGDAFLANALGMAAMQRAWEAQKIALERQARLMRKVTTDAKRLEAADAARTEGDIRLASLIYARVSRSRPSNASSEAAQARLTELASDARRKLQEIDAMLESGSMASSSVLPGETPSTAPASAEKILPAFEAYAKLVFDYGENPQVKKELLSHVAKQRAKPQYAEVLNEPEAKENWDIGQEHENAGNRCCAYWAYLDAARSAPAPSGRMAAERLEEMKADPKIVEEAQRCRDLQWCHGAYLRATMLVKANRPAEAKALFAQILQKAPAETPVYQESRAKHNVLKYLE